MYSYVSVPFILYTNRNAHTFVEAMVAYFCSSEPSSWHVLHEKIMTMIIIVMIINYFLK